MGQNIQSLGPNTIKDDIGELGRCHAFRQGCTKRRHPRLHFGAWFRMDNVVTDIGWPVAGTVHNIGVNQARTQHRRTNTGGSLAQFSVKGLGERHNTVFSDGIAGIHTANQACHRGRVNNMSRLILSQHAGRKDPHAVNHTH